MSTTVAPGILFVVSAPSGAGKTSLVNGLLKQNARLSVSISHTTRPRRANEEDGVNYHFTDHTTFARMIEQAAFLEHAEVFGNYYGTSRAGVSEQLSTGCDLVLEIDWQGAEQVRHFHPDCVSIFILPPSQAALRTRLQSRGQDEPGVIETRLSEARGEMQHSVDFDYLVVNDDFDQALDELRCIVLAEHCRTTRRVNRQSKLLQKLLSAS